eukprot:GHVU01064341.1.p1 GENE.GHVU01064341.1~~GHVU01064341.1.p1  ORF type:complete len:212 (+),score=42.46 GHVU01064341.1:22-636(+)
MATNREDTLDPALLRPGRLDRKIELPLPDRRQRRLVFQTITASMNLADEVELEDYVSRPQKVSAADIAAICQEAGMQAVRKNRYVILPKDFDKGWKAHVKKLERKLELLCIQEEYVKEEHKDLRRELLRAKEEIRRIQSVPLVIGQFLEMIDANNGIVSSTAGSNYYVRLLSTLNRELLKPSSSVALHRHSHSAVSCFRRSQRR